MYSYCPPLEYSVVKAHEFIIHGEIQFDRHAFTTEANPISRLPLLMGTISVAHELMLSTFI